MKKMMKKTFSLLLLTAGCLFAACQSQTEEKGIGKSSFQYAEKEGQQLTMDVYSEAGHRQADALRPVFIFSFGGGWETGSRRDGRRILEDFARQGYISIGIDYRLGIRQLKEQGIAIDSTNFASSYSQAVMMGVEDLYDATRFVIDHADEWKADTSRIIICGSSAGATNSLTAEYLLCNSHPLATAKLPTDFNYAAVVPLAGGVWLADTDTLCWQRKPCPILAYHGTDDQLVPFGKVVLGDGIFGGFGPDYYMPQLKQMEVSCLLHQYHRADHLIAGCGDHELTRAEIQRELQHLLDTAQHVAVTISEEFYGPAPCLADLLEMAGRQAAADNE